MAANKYPDGDIRAGDFRLDEAERADGPLVSGPQRKLAAEDYDFAQLWGNKIGLQVVFGNREAAYRMVEASFDARRHDRSGDPLDTPLTQTGMDLLVCNALERYLKARTVGDALKLTEAELEATPQISGVRITSIYASLAKFAFGQLAQQSSVA